MNPIADPILAYASSILMEEGFATSPISYGKGREMLVAENKYSVLGVVHVEDPASLSHSEAVASTKLIEILGAADLGAKRWDSYLVLLVSALVPDDGEAAERLFDISYDTSYFRRLVRVGVAVSRRSVEAALSNFRPLERPMVEPSELGDPLKLLEVELQNHGVEAGDAQLAVEAFRETRAVGGS